MLPIVSDSVISSLLARREGILNTFFSFHKVSNKAQYDNSVTKFFCKAQVIGFKFYNVRKKFTWLILQYTKKNFSSTIFDVFLVSPILSFEVRFLFFFLPSQRVTWSFQVITMFRRKFKNTFSMTESKKLMKDPCFVF